MEKGLISFGAALVARVEVGELPSVIVEAGSNARYAYEEFFFGEIENGHTRAAYKRNVDRFLSYLREASVPLVKVTPKLVRSYLEGLKGQGGDALSVPTQKQHLAALRHFFDIAVTRHAIPLNPALSVRGPKYKVVEGRTPEISVKDARKLLLSIDTDTVVGKRDLAVIATLAYTGARVGAVAKLSLKDFAHTGDQYTFRFHEKGGKSREIPVRHDLQRIILDYIAAAGLHKEKASAPLFRTAYLRTGKLTNTGASAIDLCRMVKRRFKDIGLSERYSPHSFRVTVATDLLLQGVDIKEVQYLLGHSDTRTTSLYDRRQQKVSRNIVERISV